MPPMTNPANRYQGTPNYFQRTNETTFTPCISLSGRCLRSALTIKGVTRDFNTTNISIYINMPNPNSKSFVTKLRKYLNGLISANELMEGQEYMDGY